MTLVARAGGCCMLQGMSLHRKGLLEKIIPLLPGQVLCSHETPRGFLGKRIEYLSTGNTKEIIQL